MFMDVMSACVHYRSVCSNVCPIIVSIAQTDCFSIHVYFLSRCYIAALNVVLTASV